MTKSDGTVSQVVTQTNPDGSKIIAVTAADGSTVSVTKNADGTYSKEIDVRSKNGDKITGANTDSVVNDIKGMDTAVTQLVTITSEKVPGAECKCDDKINECNKVETRKYKCTTAE
jgi:hypothetical protein